MTEHIEPLSPTNPVPFVTHGLSYEDAIARHLDVTLHKKRPYLLVSGSLARATDVVERLTARLANADKDRSVAGIRRGMRPHTLYGELVEIIAAMRSTHADSIVVVGGGTLVDAAKAVSFALANDADSVDKLDALFAASGPGGGGGGAKGDTAVKPSTLPYMCATTTLSGGEFSSFGGATDEASHQKRLFQDPSASAGHRVIAMDPRLMLTTPLPVWLSTGMRAVDHCVETVCAQDPKPAATAAALQGLRQLVPALLRTKAEPANLDARLQAQLGACQSMKGPTLYGVRMGASHGIGHQLGPHGVPHAETTCVLLPAVLKYNARVNRDQQALVLDALWNEDIVASVLQKDFHLKRETADLGDVIDAVIRALDLPRTLDVYGIGRDKLPGIAVNSLTDMSVHTNPIPLTTKEQVLEILKACLSDEKTTA